MARRVGAFLLIAAAVGAGRVAVRAAVVPTVDQYLCYKTALAKGEAKLPKDLTTSLNDRLGGVQTVDVKRVASICNPASRDGSGIAHPDVHLEGLAITAPHGAPRFVRRDRVTIDALAPLVPRTLTITGLATLLDVTPKSLGATPPAPFASDPTSDPTVNRFTCYKAKLAKGSPKFVAPAPPTIVDELFLAPGQQLVVKRVTKLCEPVDENGETPGAETRQAALVCYAVHLPRGSRFAKATVATNDADLAPQVLLATAPAELCVPASELTPTPTAPATASATPPASATPSATITATPAPTATPPAKRVFVTSTTTKGGLGGTTGADAICAGRATAAGLAGTFKAWLSVTGDGPATRFTQSAVPYRLVDGTLVANDWTDLTDGTLAHAIDVDESGTHVAADVWTGTGAAGGPLALNCTDFTDSTAGSIGTCGNTASTSSGWTQSSTPGCGLALRLYCFEQ